MPTSSAAAPTEQPKLEVQFASTDEDCIAVHRFLCVVAAPVLFCPIDAEKSIAEVLRVRDEGVSLVATFGGQIVGVLGLVPCTWWYGHGRFFTDRWFFCHPAAKHLGVGAALQIEASIIGNQAGMDIVINGKLKRRSNGVAYSAPFSIPHERAHKRDRH